MPDLGNRPAFPIPAGTLEQGVSRRDWFAAMALQGVVSKGLEVSGDRVLSDEDRNLMMATRAYGLADAMVQAGAMQQTSPA